jgi:hypothetical protein
MSQLPTGLVKAEGLYQIEPTSTSTRTGGLNGLIIHSPVILLTDLAIPQVKGFPPHPHEYLRTSCLKLS